MLSLETVGPIRRLVLRSPPVNALSPVLVAALGKVLEGLESDKTVGAMILRSDAAAFSAGGDIESMSKWLSQPDSGEALAQYARSVQAVFARLATLPFATIAAIDGAALGGGFELALCCDFRLVSPGAKLGLPELQLGLLPAAGGTQRLTRLCGPGVAARVILGSETFSGEQAVTLGLAHACAAKGGLDELAMAWAERLARQPRAATAIAKRCIEEAQREQARGFRMEIEGLAALAEEPETRARVDHFLATRSKSAR